METYLLDFSTRHDENKVIGIVQKAWARVTPRGHEGSLAITDGVRALLKTVRESIH